MTKHENWSPGMKDGLEQAQKSGKKLQYDINKTATNQREEGFNEFLEKDYVNGSDGGGSGFTGGCNG